MTHPKNSRAHYHGGLKEADTNSTWSDAHIARTEPRIFIPLLSRYLPRLKPLELLSLEVEKNRSPCIWRLGAVDLVISKVVVNPNPAPVGVGKSQWFNSGVASMLGQRLPGINYHMWPKLF
jgi:hypothetical protein